MSEDAPVARNAGTRRDRRPARAHANPERLGELTRTLATVEADGDTEIGAGLRAAALIREMRRSAGFSQSALGAAIGVSQARISEIEAGLGSQGPSFALMERIARACKVEFGFSSQGAARRTSVIGSHEMLGSSPAMAGVEPVHVVAAIERAQAVGGASSGEYAVVATSGGKGRASRGIRLTAFDHRVLDQAAGDIADTARRTGALIRGPIPLPTHIDKFTINRGPHIDKKSREQFEVRTYKRMLDIIQPTPQTVDALMRLETGAGVDVEIKLTGGAVFAVGASATSVATGPGKLTAKTEQKVRSRRTRRAASGGGNAKGSAG